MSAQEIKDLAIKLRNEAHLGRNSSKAQEKLFAAIDAQAAEIERLKECLKTCSHDYFNQLAERSEDTERAAMYRWLRTQEIGVWSDLKSRVYSLTLRVPVGLDFVSPSAEALDTAIRAAMKGGA